MSLPIPGLRSRASPAASDYLSGGWCEGARITFQSILSMITFKFPCELATHLFKLCGSNNQITHRPGHWCLYKFRTGPQICLSSPLTISWLDIVAPLAGLPSCISHVVPPDKQCGSTCMHAHVVPSRRQCGSVCMHTIGTPGR